LVISEGAARVAAHRLRQRYRDVPREENAQRLTTEAEVEDELRHLFGGEGRNRRPTTFSPAASGLILPKHYGLLSHLARPPRQCQFNAPTTLAF